MGNALIVSRQNSAAHDAAEPSTAWLGRSAAVHALLADLPRLARSHLPVLIEGESGTGRGRLARWIHDRSLRAAGPFQDIDCSAIPGEIFTRELFGHEPGAFTGATSAQRGRLRAADGGSVLFHGIDCLASSSQRALLRVYEQGEVLPLGATHAQQVDLRLLQTSHRSLRECVKSGALRADLFYRVNALTVLIPPLRERPEDIRYFLQRFLARTAREQARAVPHLHGELREQLERYSWPGNVAELEQAVAAILTLCEKDRIGLADLPQDLRRRLLEGDRLGTATYSIPAQLGFTQQVETFQKVLLQRAWRECRHDRKALLERLQLAPHQLRYLQRKLGLEFGPPHDESL